MTLGLTFGRLTFGFILVVLFSPFFLSPSAVAAEDKPRVVAQAEAKWCYRCHGEYGFAENTRIPNLAGQNEAYLVNQLRQFRLGTDYGAVDDSKGKSVLRVHRSMAFNAKRLTDGDIKETARYYAAISCYKPRPKSIALKVPAMPAVAEQCTGCHGEDGLSQGDEIPKLAGQHALYIVNQLKKFRQTGADGVVTELRDWRRHPQMGKIAAGLSDQDMQAVATYFESLACR